MQPYIVGLSGSPGENSLTAAAIKYALRGAEAVGARTKLLQLNEYKLLIAGSVNESEYPNDVFYLRNELKKSDGIIIGTPEHNNSISGILKNAIDLMGKMPFENKVTGLIGLAGGTTGATNALNNLMIICRSLHSWVSPNLVSIASTDKVFDVQQNINDIKIVKRLFQLGYSTAKLACNFKKIYSDLLYNFEENFSAINHR